VTDPRPAEFRRFIELLTADAPDGYRPWLFRVEEGTKAPDTSFGSWKSERARVSPEEAVGWMERGGNVGIAGRPDDPLINVDIDDEDKTTPDDLKPTLMARSRSRTGVHAWYFEDTSGEEIPNIPTDDAGEIRANWQYVVAPGSYVESDDVNPDDLPDGQRDELGYYTVAREDPVAHLTYDELPAVFRDQQTADAADDVELVDDDQHDSPSLEDFEQPDSVDRDSNSALFDIEARDIILKEDGGSTDPSERWASVFHGSGTESNMSYSDEGLLHCWRHEVAHNGLQALAVLSDYDGSCADVGSAHKRSGAGRSCLGREEGAHIWHAWKYAKRNGYIPDDDPVPYVALKHLCRERDLCTVTELPDGPDETMPAHAYDAALATIENNEELDPGRERTDEIDDTGQAAAADGGAAAATADSTASVSEQDELLLTPDGVMRKAFNDVHGRLQKAVDEPDPTIHDLRNAEAATYTWQVLQDRGDDDVIGVSDGTLRTYDGAVWTRDGDAAEQRLREQSRRALMSKYSSQVLEQLKEQVRATNYHHVDELGIDEPWVVAGDEALNLKTRETRPVERDDLALRRINAEYDPDAEPDLWLDFLSRVAATPETIAKVQEYFGYCLWVHGQPFGKALFLVGDTDSGKGTALKTLETILGRRENVANEALQDLIETRWGKAELYGKMANVRNEVTPGGVQNVEEFKELLGGGDRVSAEFKGQDKFQFEVTQKFLFATNQFPDVENADRAFWNRCLFARFPETIPADEQRPNFHDDLLNERAGILNWMLEGLDRLFEQEEFTGERAIADKRTIAEEVGSPLERLKQEALEITREPDDLVHARDLYDLAVAYADANDMDGGVPAWQGGAFTSELRRWPGVEKGQSRRVGDDGRARVFKGLRVDPDIATELEADVRTDSESDRKQSSLDV